MKKVKALMSLDGGSSESVKAISEHCDLGKTVPEYRGIYISLSPEELEDLHGKLLKVTITEAGKWRPKKPKTA